jgi:hypothetical protein
MVTITTVQQAQQPQEPTQPVQRITITRPAEVPLTLDLDDRAVLYPSGKGITRIALSSAEGGVAFDATFSFNHSKTAPRIMVLSLEDARVFGRALVDSVYQARPQNAITETMRIGITVHTNGFHVDIGDTSRPIELFIGLPSIWRFALLVLRAVDRLSPVEAN